MRQARAETNLRWSLSRTRRGSLIAICRCHRRLRCACYWVPRSPFEDGRFRTRKLPPGQFGDQPIPQRSRLSGGEGFPAWGIRRRRQAGGKKRGLRLLPIRPSQLVGAGLGGSPEIRCIEVILGNPNQGEQGVAPCIG
jgi:hypothetical protein